MSSIDQNSVDDLLAKVQGQAQAVKSAVDAGVSQSAESEATAAVDSAAGQVREIAGEMEPPVPRNAADIPAAGPSPAARGAVASAPATLLGDADVHRLLAIEVPVIVQLGMRRLTVGEVMRLAVGAIVEFGKSAEEELDLLANNKAIGKGHAVKVGENFGIKISTVGSVKETIRKLGGQ